MSSLKQYSYTKNTTSQFSLAGKYKHEAEQVTY